MFEQQLEQSGLTKNQAIVYEALLKTGAVPARAVLAAIPFKRGLAYKTLDELASLGLVIKKEEPGKIAIFEPVHPTKLKEIAEAKEKEAQNAQITLEAVLGELTSNYNLISGKPGLRFYEGILGIKKIYDDILAVGEDFLFIRSTYEPVYKEKILPIVDDFIKKRVAKKIKCSVLSPSDVYPTAADRTKREAEDRERLIERTWVEKSFYSAPVEIDIYGNRVALISFGQELVGVIIESPQISQALKQIFALAQLGAKGATSVLLTQTNGLPDSPQPPGDKFPKSQNANYQFPAAK